MGKRKKSSRGPQGPKKRESLATVFKCIFCNHETSINVKIDKKSGVGNLNCKSCGVTFQTGVNYLSAPVDVYSDWIDACDTVAHDAEGTTTLATASSMRPTQNFSQSRPGVAANEKYTAEDDDGFIEDDELDAEAEYADE